MRRRRLAWGATAVLAVTSALAAVTIRASATTTYPVNYNALTAFATGTALPDVPPPGANNYGCRSTEHPYPVVLGPGTGGNENDYWQAVAPELANNGYCVYTVTIGQTWYSGGLGDIASMYTSASELSSFIDNVLAKTGASKVDLVGHSQGGTIELIYLQYDGGAAKVHRLIGLAGANSGVVSVSGLSSVVNSIPGLSTVIGIACPACGQLDNPATYTALSPKTYPNVQYTNIVSTHDEFITPYTLAFEPAAPNVTNETVQSICPDDTVGHLGLVFDPAGIQMLMNALDPQNPQPVTCDVGLGF
jgi:triacylglycerol esterase/lipase EstA (alpha/beta hydrolase family)